MNISDFLQAVEDGLIEEVADRTLDEETLSIVISGEEDVGADMQRDTRASCEALKNSWIQSRDILNRRKNVKNGVAT